MNDEIIRRVKVDRTRTAEEVFGALNRARYLEPLALERAPSGTGSEVEVHFFKVHDFLYDDDVMDEYRKRKLVPDFYAQAAVNEEDPAFADQYPNGAICQDKYGMYFSISFDRSRCFDLEKLADEELYQRRIDLSYNGIGWSAYWWLAGVPVDE